MTTYKVVRYFQDSNRRKVTVATRLSLEAAQAHCEDPETSSKTCTTRAGKARTRKYGSWFEGYREEA